MPNGSCRMHGGLSPGLDSAFLAHCRLRRLRVFLQDRWLDAKVYPKPPGAAPRKEPFKPTISIIWC
jgi:hypothetical protein